MAAVRSDSTLCCRSSRSDPHPISLTHDVIGLYLDGSREVRQRRSRLLALDADTGSGDVRCKPRWAVQDRYTVGGEGGRGVNKRDHGG